MAEQQERLRQAAETAFALQEIEVSHARERELRSVVAQTATGTANIDHTFGLDQKYRLVFVRCHYSGTTGSAAFSISVDSGNGSAYDVKLHSIAQAGKGKDVNYAPAGTDLREPSSWTLQAADKIRVQWINPDSGNITWGLEVGLVLAS